MPDDVAAAFDALPPEARRGLFALRGLILRVAAECDAGPITEALRWGQPAYFAPKGTTLRLGAPKTGGFALYAHCRTPLIPDFRDMTGGRFATEGNRAVLFREVAEIDEDALAPLIARALTWHRRAA
ncbi:MAG: DUF1801 domain-containing protein [Pseudomonadota bacterium]|nr:DUF1801 domain-containing protein [Pseudomonadota bacterium]